MKKRYLFLVFIFIGLFGHTQIIKPLRNNGLYANDSTSFKDEVKVKLNGKTSYTDYKIIDFKKDTTIVDTTLTIEKYYKFNFRRKDNFDLLAFHNQGETFTTLLYHFENESVLPNMGFSAKQFNYYQLNDILYYHVPTPTSELMYRTGLQQGQTLDAFLTLNTSKQLNFSIAYKGLRSLGRYKNALASHGNFRFTFNYQSKNERYALRGHIYSFDFSNQENGGLTATAIQYFESNDPNYIQRERLDVNYTNATSLFEGKRYYFDQNYTLATNQRKQKKSKIDKKKVINGLKNKMLNKKNIAQKPDSIAKRTLNKALVKKSLTQPKKKEISLKIGTELLYETKHYHFNQTSASTLYGDVYTLPIADKSGFQQTKSTAYTLITSPYLGKLKGGITYYDYNYNFNRVLNLTSGSIPSRIKGNALMLEANWKTNFKHFYITANGSSMLTGNLNGNNLYASIYYEKPNQIKISGFVNYASKSPNFNKILYQSEYKDYNWFHNFKNEQYATIGFETKFKNTFLTGSFNHITNFTYFDENNKPTQSSTDLNYFKLKLKNTITVGKFSLTNTIAYQKVANGSDFFRVPDVISRNTLYFSSYVFKGKPMYLQTGVSLKYFSAYKANAFNPLINEFVIQNSTKIGNYPILDFFINAQIRRTRLFLNVENFSAGFTGRNYYAAPNYPYRDLTVRFGLVWNFFI